MDFKLELDKLIQKIEDKEPMCFVRYGDGEAMIMNNQPISTNTQAYSVDKWSSNGGQTKMGFKLKEILKTNDPQWLFGIPCECCNLMCKNYLMNELNVGHEQITYANMFVNSNYIHFLDQFPQISNRIPNTLIASYLGITPEFLSKIRGNITRK